MVSKCWRNPHLHTILFLTQLSYSVTYKASSQVSDICIHLANKEVIKTWKSDLYQVGTKR